MARTSISVQLKYKVPQMRLCLVSDRKLSRLQHISSPEDAGRLLAPLRYSSEEQFVSLHLNCRHEVIGLHEVSKGTIASSLVHPREVFKAALLANSYAILVCHNHPSGSRLSPVGGFANHRGADSSRRVYRRQRAGSHHHWSDR